MQLIIYMFVQNLATMSWMASDDTPAI